MLYTVIASSLIVTATAANVDVEGAFHNYCSSWCGAGGIANCDIGNGNIVRASAQLQAKVLEGKPGTNKTSDNNLLGATGCDEKGDQHSCHDGYWCDFPYKCTAPNIGYEGIAYSNIITKAVDAQDGFVFTHWIDNDTPTDQSTTVNFDEKTANSATISLTETVSVGFSSTIKAGVPGVMEGSFTEKFDLSVSSTQSHTLTSTTGWNIEQPVIAKANTTVKATLVIQKVTVSGDWTATMELPQTAKVWCNQQVKGHWEWFIPASFYLPQDQCSGDKCPVKGRFEGFHGVSSSTVLKDCPLYSRDC